jgi:ferredoxin
VALDVALADRTAHERTGVYTIAASVRRGLVDLSRPYELLGDAIVPDPQFVPVRRDLQRHVPHWLQRTLRNLVTARPRLVDEPACTRCGDCASICGADAITLAPTPVYDDNACVRCYACTEVCPTRAIDNVSPFLSRLLSRKTDRATS